MNRSSWAKGLLLLAVSAALSACGGQTSSWVSSATFTQSQQGNDQYANVTAMLNTGNTLFAAVALPIMDSNGNIFGQVSVIPGTAAGTAQLSVSMDISKFGTAPTGSYVNTLPNGLPFPVIGGSYTAYPVGTGGSEFYANISPDLKSIDFGVALIITGFDAGVPASVFMPYTISSSFAGVAGAFTGATKTQSGFGLFANVNIGTIIGADRTHGGTYHPVFVPTSPNSPDFKTIGNMLPRLNAEHAHLSIR